MGKLKPENQERLTRSFERLRGSDLHSSEAFSAEVERLVSEGAPRTDARNVAAKALRILRGEMNGHIVGKKKSGTRPNVSLILTDEELEWCAQHGGNSAAIHAALAEAMKK